MTTPLEWLETRVAWHRENWHTFCLEPDDLWLITSALKEAAERAIRTEGTDEG